MFTYLAIPYRPTGPGQEQPARRMHRFWDAAAALHRNGERVVSPMTLEPMTLRHPEAGQDWQAWKDYAYRLMSICDKVVVLKLDGWEESEGVKGEIEMAAQLGLPVVYEESEFAVPPPVIRAPRRS